MIQFTNALLKSKFSKSISIKSQHLSMSSCITKEDDIMTTRPTHISCPLRNVTIKCLDNSFVDHKRDCPNYVECPSFNPIKCGNGEKFIWLSLVHCTDKYPVLFNDGSCRSSKIICQKPSNKIKFFSRNVSFKLLSINKSGINGKKMTETCPFKLNHSA